MKYIRFNDSQIDSQLFLRLENLSIILTGVSKLNFDFNYGTFIDVINKKITASHFWDHMPDNDRISGLKSDIFLRSIGTLHYSDASVLKTCKKWTHDSNLPFFDVQLFTLFEDTRLEELIKKERLGTSKDFQIRTNIYHTYFQSQAIVNKTRGFELDELFSLIYLTLRSPVADPSFSFARDKQLASLEKIKPFIFDVYDAKNTNDIFKICQNIVYHLEDDYKDCINQYFIFPVHEMESVMTDSLFDELKRKDELINGDREEIDEDKNEVLDDTISTWHRENENGERNQTFLQFELESGTKTSLMGNGARDSEDSDQAMASIQGSSSDTKRKDYSDKDALTERKNEQKSGKKNPYGEDNRYAVPIVKKSAPPSSEDRSIYQNYLNEMEPHKRKLYNTIAKTLEHKQNLSRKNRLFGRLSKKLLPLIIDEQPRVFYKKNAPSPEIDAVFTLLVDCSASMQNKMEQTKKGILLFHEVLYHLHIPHSIIGFWEDGNEVKADYQPNYFHHIHTFSDSLLPETGAKIMQLQPEEDNRDGFSIRIAVNDLEQRNEKHKFLLVFSDGEPAATHYEQNGIIDTHQAVLEARKKGIEVLGMFLSDGEIVEQEEKTMMNIYGKEHLMIPDVSFLPDYFSPILKRLILKSI